MPYYPSPNSLNSLNIGTADAMVLHGAPVAADIQVNSDTIAVQEIHTHSATAGIASALYMARSRGTTALPAVVQSGDAVRIDSAVAYDGTDYEEVGQTRWSVGGTPGSNDMPGKWELLVTPDGGVVPAVALTVTPDKALALAVPLAAGSGGTGLSSLGAGVATLLGTPSSANLAAALTDETGSGAAVFATSPTLVTPALGTPSSGVLSSCTGYKVAGAKDYTQASFGLTTSVTIIAGHATSAIGYIPRRACHMKRLLWLGACTAASGSPAVTLTVYKNASSGAGARVLQSVSGTLVNGTGYYLESTTILNALDAFNGTTDYLTMTIQVTTGTSCTISFFNARIEWDDD